MYFEKAEMPKRLVYKKSDNQNLLEAFINSGLDCARVKDWNNKSAENAANSLNASAKRYGLRVQALLRNGEVYLLRKELAE